MAELQKLFGGKALTYEAFCKKAKAGGMNLVDLAQGEYVKKDSSQQASAQNAQGEEGDPSMQSALASLRAQYDAALSAAKMEGALDAALLRAGVRNPRAVRALLDESKLSMENDTICGLAPQLEALRVSDGYLFQAPVNGSDEGGYVCTGRMHGAQESAQFDKFLTAAMAAAGIQK